MTQIRRLLGCDKYNTKVIVLERTDENAWNRSIYKAMSSGNWGTTPEMQAAKAFVTNYTVPPENLKKVLERE